MSGWKLVVALSLGSSLCAAEEPRSETLTVKGVKIHYLVAGAGEPVLLIHGLHASAELNWKLPGIFADLAKDHLVIAIDLPGHGQSDRPANEAAYGDQLVDDVALLLDRLQIEKAHLVGYSLGGMVTAMFLVKYPDRVLSGTLGGMGWFQAGSPLQRFWERIPTRDGARTPPEFLHTVGKLAINEADLRGIKAPVKVLIGDRDPVQRLYVDPLRPVRPDWPVVVIADAGHMNCVFKEQFRTELTNWLRKP